MAGDNQGAATTERLAGALARLLVPAALAVLGVAGAWAVGDAVLTGSPAPKAGR